MLYMPMNGLHEVVCQKTRSAYYLLTLVQQNTKLQYSLAIYLSVIRTEMLKD